MMEVLSVLECGECGVRIYLSRNYLASAKTQHRPIYCPNGHRNGHPSPTPNGGRNETA